MKRIARSAIVEHSAQEMYALVDDIERYPGFLPWCSDARVEEVDGRKRATLTVGLKGLRQSFTTLNDNRPPEAIDMQLVEGPFRSFSATWRFRPLGQGACKIEFTMEYEFASAMLGRLLEPLFDQIADTMVDAFQRRADVRP
jgi:ribosome-associated toxin RatA of RatAB toxin-antitoxin module